MAEKKSNVLEIIQGISQAAANAYDGAIDENGDPLKTGLMREEGHPILDKRVMDGFGVCFAGNILKIKYQGEVTLREIYKGDFEGEIAQRLQDIASFLKKEYKKITGNGLTLTKVKDKEPEMIVQSTSKVRSWVQAHQEFTIGGIPENPELGHTVEERLDDSIKKWLGMGKDKFPKTKKPENVSGKRDEEPREKKKIAEAQESDSDKEELGKGGMSGTEYSAAEREDVSKGTEQTMGFDNREKQIIRQVTDILKKYAQTANLAGGGERALLMKAIGPLKKALKKQSKS